MWLLHIYRDRVSRPELNSSGFHDDSQIKKTVFLFFLTSPPLSLRPRMFGCWDSCITASSGSSRPVLAGTLYRTTGTGLLSATCRGDAERRKTTPSKSVNFQKWSWLLLNIFCKWHNLYTNNLLEGDDSPLSFLESAPVGSGMNVRTPEYGP